MRATLIRIGGVLAAAATVVALAGCQGSGGQADAGGSEQKAASPSATPAALGPLEEYQVEVQSIYGVNDKTWNLQQQKIAQCMADQGFQYKAVPMAEAAPSQAEIDAKTAAMARPEFYTKYGYGITIKQPGPEETEPSQPADPNKAMTDAMSEAERAAYTTALNGSGKPEGGARREKGDVDDSWQYSGCTGKAEHEVLGGPGSEQDPDYETLRKEMVQFDDQMWSGTQITGLNTKWSACMTDAGYTDEFLRTPTDASTFVMDNAGKNGRNDEQKQQFELSVAKADYGCQDKISYQSKLTQAKHDAQAQFVSEHKAELDAWVAAARKYAGDNGLNDVK